MPNYATIWRGIGRKRRAQTSGARPIKVEISDEFNSVESITAI